MDKSIIITVGVVTAIALVFASVTAFTTLEENPFKDKRLFELGMNLPIIWIYLDDSDVNSRSWLDFMGRSTRAINLPFLNLCYQTLVMQNKDQYRVEIISGLSDVAARLGCELPTPLQRPQVSMGVTEKSWIRAAILKKYGGLWLDPSSIAIAPFGKMSDKVVFFGTDEEETYSGPKGTPAPGFHCLWSPEPEHPLFVKWEEMTRKRLETQIGGKNFRGDEKWDIRQLATDFAADLEYQPYMELSRKANGKRIQLDDLLLSGQQGILPFDVQKESRYVVIPWPELRDSRKFGWFLRMSEEQIMQSDLVITEMFKISIQ
jgi:hypothetical protein